MGAGSEARPVHSWAAQLCYSRWTHNNLYNIYYTSTKQGLNKWTFVKAPPNWFGTIRSMDNVVVDKFKLII